MVLNVGIRLLIQPCLNRVEGSFKDRHATFARGNVQLGKTIPTSESHALTFRLTLARGNVQLGKTIPTSESHIS